MRTITLIPAYGRDYRRQEQVLEDFANNLDFTVADISDRWDGKPVNRSQLAGYDLVRIRYAGLRRFVAIRQGGAS